MILFGEKKIRVRYLKGKADVALPFTPTPGDVRELPAPKAREEIADGWAEAAPDAPVENAPTPIEEFDCPRCATSNSRYALQCSTCRMRFA